MRKLTETLAGRELTFAATFDASMEICDKIRDPMEIVQISATTQMMRAHQIDYTPEWAFDTVNIPIILHIGAKAAGEDISLKQMQELVFEHGFYNSMAVATDYVGIIIGPVAEDSGEDSGEKEPTDGKK
jgi:hypothetical protein